MIIKYGITLALAAVLLIAYLCMIRKREFWLGLLFVCVTVVNLGYLLTAAAKTVEFAVFGNDVAYLGSVFLPVCMFFTALRLCGVTIKKKYTVICVTLASVMFAIIATVGFLPWYYKDVSVETVNGATVLIKEYGVLHPIYTVYLVGYFVSMIAVIVYAAKSKTAGAHKFAGLIAGVVLGNIIVWVFDKFSDWDFELLSLTYILSEIVLFLVCWMMQDYVIKGDASAAAAAGNTTVVVVDSLSKAEKLQRLLSRLPGDKTLTAKEIEILGELVDGKSRKDIAAAHHISENTVKTHVTHIYEKFGVSSKEALTALLHTD